ncbi:MAG: 50S ribosomal protein L11 [Patescibacteria group bacterium]
MAEIIKKVRLVAPGGQATPAPPIGPILGSAGINIGEFTNQFNEATKDKMGEPISVLINVFDDRSFKVTYKTTPTTHLIKKAAGIKSGSPKASSKRVGSITMDQAREIAEKKIPDLNCHSIDEAVKVIEGSCKSMGIEIK